jgi:hypothetical protein
VPQKFPANRKITQGDSIRRESQEVLKHLSHMLCSTRRLHLLFHCINEELRIDHDVFLFHERLNDCMLRLQRLAVRPQISKRAICQFLNTGGKVSKNHLSTLAWQGQYDAGSQEEAL